ncbi:hypothetical protein Y026_953 [Burkholderia pseudomallei TSV28]|uniref:hypothetical protein n=2 Tax=Burkholderia TaxID=32008 RepID=UPI000536DC52|nr:hypothetical protein [Burkholderia pseudomallei]KGX70135.1 hypothetical protein Y026_953 [Burkholderia pseudomallei TSV28]
MAELNAALVGFLGVLVGGYGSNFLAEDYRRFRDSRALAGALAGELESHGEAVPILKDGLERMGNKVLAGEKLDLPEWPIPPSPLFDENASKIGLLGPELARDVAYVYEHLRAFRQNFHQLTKHHTEMPPEWTHSNIMGCLAILTRMEPRGRQLIVNLKNHADVQYRSLPETQTQLKYGAAGFIAFLILLKLFA